MKVKRFFIFIALVAEYLAANAQYTFQVITAVNNGKPQISTWWPSYSTRELCEQRRREVERNLTFSSYLNLGEGRGARIILKTTTTPCTGPGGGAIGSVDLLGVDRGGSFFSTNPANEIRDWSEDDMRRMTALGKDINSYEPQDLSTGDVTADLLRNKEREMAKFKIPDSSKPSIDLDKPFISLNLNTDGSYRWGSADLSAPKECPANMSEVNRCLNAIDINNPPRYETGKEYIEWIKEVFRNTTGYDVDVLQKKTDLTASETEALANYREVLNSMSDIIVERINEAYSEENTLFTMSAISEDCYKDSKHENLSNTGYLTFKNENLPDNSPLKDVINLSEDLDGKDGFHSQWYYNEKTNEYTLAFEGTNFSELADISDDAIQGLGLISNQFEYAKLIADKVNQLPPDIKINITGHSLGGGLASLVGAITGRPTYTFNAEGVNDEIRKAYGIADRNRSDYTNIKAYYNEADPLSRVQDKTGEKIAAPPLGQRISLGDISTTKEIETKEILKKTSIVGTIIASGVYAKRDHSINTIIRYCQEKLEKRNEEIAIFSNERSRAAMRSISSIQVNIE